MAIDVELIRVLCIESDSLNVRENNENFTHGQLDKLSCIINLLHAVS